VLDGSGVARGCFTQNIGAGSPVFRDGSFTCRAGPRFQYYFPAIPAFGSDADAEASGFLT